MTSGLKQATGQAVGDDSLRSASDRQAGQVCRKRGNLIQGPIPERGEGASQELEGGYSRQRKEPVKRLYSEP